MLRWNLLMRVGELNGVDERDLEINLHMTSLLKKIKVLNIILIIGSVKVLE